MIYLFVMESTYYLNSEANDAVFNENVSKEASKRMKNMLKENERNVFLWSIYAEIEFLKSKKIIVRKRL